ncbi:MAG: hypothetical protein K2N98_10225 [Lachnospiraceae bacterium]|nr:hypothetical protein [Lachnospiraceae bacterium]
MECSYIVQEGELLLNNRRRNRLTVYLMFFFYVFQILGILLTFGLTMYLTYIIFRECITEITLNNCIPLGAIFATFGSAVISVLSLYCNRQINLFQENLSALHEQIPEMTSWKRWPFLKRHGWESAGWRKVNFYTLKNPQLIFKCGERCLTMELPTCSADFYDLPIAIGIIRMLGFYRYFSKAAFQLKNEEQQKDLLVFYCALMIYRNIFRYKAGTFLMLIGSEFVLASIIFSFFYQSISSFLL